jgi:hypothetical protein
MKSARDKGPFFKMVILTIEAIKGTGMIKDGQIFVTVFRALHVGILGIPATSACWADKISYAIGGKGIIVVRKLPLVRPSAPYLATSYMAYAAKTSPAFRDLTPVLT